MNEELHGLGHAVFDYPTPTVALTWLKAMGLPHFRSGPRPFEIVSPNLIKDRYVTGRLDIVTHTVVRQHAAD